MKNETNGFVPLSESVRHADPSLMISSNRYQELLTAEVKLNMIIAICEKEKYVYDADIRRIIGLEVKKYED